MTDAFDQLNPDWGTEISKETTIAAVLRTKLEAAEEEVRSLLRFIKKLLEEEVARLKAAVENKEMVENENFRLRSLLNEKGIVVNESLI